jgi:hypothetical protein
MALRRQFGRVYVAVSWREACVRPGRPPAAFVPGPDSFVVRWVGRPRFERVRDAVR